MKTVNIKTLNLHKLKNDYYIGGLLIMKKKIGAEICKDLFADIIGGFLIAIGVYNFASASQFPIAGVNGIALIFYQLFHLPIGTMAIVLNIPIALFTFRILGKRFFAKSIKSMIISSVIIDIIAPFFPVYEGDRLLAAICCGVLSGLGYALIFMRDSSTGGADFITVAIRVKHPHFSFGKIVFAMDVIIIILGTALVSQDIDSLIYGVIISYLMSVVMDRLMYGISQGKVAMIVTDYGHEICRTIDDHFGRGSTILKGKGSYSQADKDVVMCACNKKQMYGIRKLIKQVDPKSFLVIMDSSDVVGEGFQKE